MKEVRPPARCAASEHLVREEHKVFMPFLRREVMSRLARMWFSSCALFLRQMGRWISRRSPSLIRRGGTRVDFRASGPRKAAPLGDAKSFATDENRVGAISPRKKARSHAAGSRQPAEWRPPVWGGLFLIGDDSRVSAAHRWGIGMKTGWFSRERGRTSASCGGFTAAHPSVRSAYQPFPAVTKSGRFGGRSCPRGGGWARKVNKQSRPIWRRMSMECDKACSPVGKPARGV